MTNRMATVKTEHSIVRGSVFDTGENGTVSVTTLSGLRVTMGKETPASTGTNTNDLSEGYVIRMVCGHYRRLIFNDPFASTAKFWCSTCDNASTFDSCQLDDSVWWVAYQINYPGACNPTAVARELMGAIHTVRSNGGVPREHKGVMAIAGQLNFLLGISLGPEIDELDEVVNHAKTLGIYRAGL